MSSYFKVYWVFSVILATVSSSSGQLTPAKAQGREQDFAAAKTEIPFHLYRNYLVVVEGSLGEIGKVNFLIDTGADPSVVDTRAAQNLHLRGTAGTLAVLNRTVSVERALLPTLRLGPLRKQSFPVLVRDLAFLERTLGIRVDAVIGLDVLSQSSFSINYRTKVLAFGSDEACSATLPFETDPPFVTVQMKVQDIPVRLLIDTGASGLALFKSRIRTRLPRLDVLREGSSSNMAGSFHLTEVLLPRSYLGQIDFGRLKASVVDDQEDKGRDFDGLLGISALGLASIAFDFQGRTFCWKR